jgi:hypothetical protein
MAIVNSFSPGAGVLSVFGDALDNSVTLGCNTAGTLLVNGGAVPVLVRASSQALAVLEFSNLAPVSRHRERSEAVQCHASGRDCSPLACNGRVEDACYPSKRQFGELGVEYRQPTWRVLTWGRDQCYSVAERSGARPVRAGVSRQ